MTAGPRPPGAFGRVILPSPADVVFLFGFALVLWRLPTYVFGDGDTGWHIRTGDLILADRALPRADPFSFTRAGEPWMAWEWLADVLLALVHRAAGLDGLLVLAALLVSLVSSGLYTLVRARGGDPLLSLALVTASSFSAMKHWFVRPHLFTHLLALVALALCEAHRLEPERRRRIFLLVPLAALWANLHPGFVIAPLLAAVYAAGALVEALARKDGALARARSFAAVAAASAAATLVNPYGSRLHAHVLAYLGDPYLRHNVAENLPPDLADRFFAPFALVALALAVAALLRPRRLDAAGALLAGAWLVLALRSARHVPLFLLFALPGLGRLLGDLPARLAPLARVSAVLAAGERSFNRHLWPAAAVAVMTAVALGGGSLRGVELLRAGFPEEVYPVAAVDRLAGVIASSRTFHPDHWGGYLIYKLRPRARVFIDGRSDFYGATFLREYQGIAAGSPGWEEALERFGVDLALVEAKGPLALRLARSRAWSKRHEDGVCVAYARTRGSRTIPSAVRRRAVVMGLPHRAGGLPSWTDRQGLLLVKCRATTFAGPANRRTAFLKPSMSARKSGIQMGDRGDAVHTRK